MSEERHSSPDLAPSANGARRVLIVDDELANVRLLEAIVTHDGALESRSTTDSREVLSLVTEYRPDIVLLDLMMPYLDGFAILEQLKPQVLAEGYLPVLVLTADNNPDTMRRALSSGATDFLTKPFDPTEVLLRIRNLLHTRSLYRQLQEHGRTLESRVSRRTQQLETAKLEILERLARTTEYRDDLTGEHTKRVGENAARLWRHLGLDGETEEVIMKAAPLHDVGKVGIPDSILLKPGPLTAEETEIMKGHTVIGASILAGSGFDVLQMGERIARSHHERWDGSGYPDGLASGDIPIEARIVLVCDVFDALTQRRPYKAAWPVDAALAEIAAMSGTMGDPEVVAAFLELTSAGEILVGRSDPRHPSA